MRCRDFIKDTGFGDFERLELKVSNYLHEGDNLPLSSITK
jgi:hypothetical protein